MKIISGNFGNKGTAYVHKKQSIVIDGLSKAEYSGGDIKSINANTEKENKTSFLSIILGIILTIVLTVAFSIVGLIAGVLITWLGSRYSIKHESATLIFNDDKTLTTTCTPREIKALYALKQ